jgi:hypothetical protein
MNAARIFIFKSEVDARLRLWGRSTREQVASSTSALAYVRLDRTRWKSSVSASARANRRSHQSTRPSARRRLHRDSRVVASGLLFNNFVATRVELSKYGPNQMFSVHIRHQHLRSIGTLSGFREINVRILNGAKHNTENLGFDHGHPPEKPPAPPTTDTIPARISGIAFGKW